MSNGFGPIDSARPETLTNSELEGYMAYLEDLTQLAEWPTADVPDTRTNIEESVQKVPEEPVSRLPEGVEPYIDTRKLPVPLWALLGGVSALGVGAKVTVDYLDHVEPQNLSAAAIGVGAVGLLFFGISEKFDKFFSKFRRNAKMSDGEGVSNGHMTRRTVGRISGALGLAMVVTGTASGGAAFYQEQLVNTVSDLYHKQGDEDDGSETGGNDSDDSVSILGCESAEYIRCEIDENGGVRRVLDYVARIEASGEYECSEIGEPIFLSLERSRNNKLNNPWGGLVYDRGTDPAVAEAIRKEGLLDLGGTLNRGNSMIVGNCVEAPSDSSK